MFEVDTLCNLPSDFTLYMNHFLCSNDSCIYVEWSHIDAWNPWWWCLYECSLSEDIDDVFFSKLIVSVLLKARNCVLFLHFLQEERVLFHCIMQNLSVLTFNGTSKEHIIIYCTHLHMKLKLIHVELSRNLKSFRLTKLLL